MAQRFATNAVVWIPDPTETWVEASVVRQIEDNVVLCRKGSTAEIVLPAKTCYLKDDVAVDVDDMKNLSYLHEPGVLHNLCVRYKANQIYTYTGNILIAVNPFTVIPGLYDKEVKNQYQKVKPEDAAPHVFAIADSAYRAMMSSKQSQSILISGESGAGKTETTKLVMEYLAGLAAGGNLHKDRSVESQVLESNPILEAFGNAKTSRNSNSSRFGKFIRIQFDKSGKVIGALIKSYLLEKSRVVQIRSPERNYHCFYQMCAGITSEEASRFKLPSVPHRARMFYYLNQSDCYDLDEGRESNAQMFKETKKAMTVVGISEAEQDAIFRILSAILHLGNIEFVESGSGGELTITSQTGVNHVDIAAELLGCNWQHLEASLCKVARKIGSEVIFSNLSAKAACVKRDSLAKNLYSKLFDWIVNKINNSICPRSESAFSIGVLDIYGFEHFETNSFEQFCINYANEKLQQHFNQHVLKSEQDEYELEGIDWTRVPFVDNQDCLDLIESSNTKAPGILSVLDSCCKLESSTNATFTSQLYKQCSRSGRFLKSKGTRPIDFTIEHYAGKVKYATDDFIAKNTDSVVLEHEILLSHSQDPFLAAMFSNPNTSRGGRNKFISLGNLFKSQLSELMDTLAATSPHYIRCVKPNAVHKPSMFENSLVTAQLRSGGVLEAVRMCLSGYPTRMEFEDFTDRFRILLPSGAVSDDLRTNCSLILSLTSFKDYQIGKHKLFFRAGQLAELEAMRLEILNSAARKIQTRFRKHLLVIRRSAAIVLQAFFRYHLASLAAHDRLREVAAIRIQRFVRSVKKRAAAKRFWSLVMTCQILARQKLARIRLKKAKQIQAAATIQRVWRGYRSRRPYLFLKKYVRGWRARRLLASMKKDGPHTAPTVRIRALETKIDVLNAMLDSVSREKTVALKELEKTTSDNDWLKSVLVKRDDAILKLKKSLKDTRQELKRAQDEKAKLHAQVPPANQHISVNVKSGVPEVVPPQKVVIDKQDLLPPISEPEKPSKAASKLSKIGETFQRVRFVKQASHIENLSTKNSELAAANKELEKEMKAVKSDLTKANESVAKQLEAKDRLIADLTSKNEFLLDQLARKERLEQEIKSLGRKLLEVNLTKGVQPVSANLENLLDRVTSNRLEFTASGHSLAAITLFNSLRTAKTFELEESSALDRIVEVLVISAQDGTTDDVAYWLTVLASFFNLVFTAKSSRRTAEKKTPKKTSLFGKKIGTERADVQEEMYEVPENISSLLFTVQLWTGVERLYEDLRDLAKSQMHETLQASIGKVTPASARFHNFSTPSELSNEAKPRLIRSTTFIKRQVTSYWAAMATVIRQTMDTMQYSHVPLYLIYCMTKDLLYFLNLKVFNSLLVKSRWCPCTYGNGEAMLSEIAKIKSWLSTVDDSMHKMIGGPPLPKLSEQLNHISEAVLLLLLDNKPSKSLEEILQLCPNLSMNQVVYVCQWYVDEKYCTPGVDPTIIAQMSAKIEPNSTFLLEDERGIPFNIDEVMALMVECDQIEWAVSK